MTLNDFARRILFGTSLQEKLEGGPEGWSDGGPEGSKEPIEIPSFPGRPASLSRPGKAKFPSLYRLDVPIERGKVLHFFANHELLAMELMALMLLRFPDASTPFRRGIAQIIQEEQSHLRLYLDRMKELGIEFGDLPVNDYFWNSMKGMTSPLDFTVQMSLTFEQANLDFSLFFMKAIEKTGDHITAAILERVFREEIGHVKHGLTWFNRWRKSSIEGRAEETDWAAYVRLLPFPLTPQRAKGFEWCEEARQQAGFSDTYIRELRAYSSSKGRPPVLWFFNPHCDSEIARGTPGFSPSEGAKNKALDLECMPAFLASNQDVVLVHQRPNIAWIESLQQCGFKTPEWIEAKSNDFASLPFQKISGIEPWGWSPEVTQKFRPLQSRLVQSDGGNSEFCQRLFGHESFEQSGLRPLFSKSWSVQFLERWMNQNPSTHEFFGGLESVGVSATDWTSATLRIQQILREGFPVMLKAPYGTSGMQVKRLQKSEELTRPLGNWIKNTLSEQGSIVVEPYLEKHFDLSIQMEIQETRTQLFEARQFITGSRHEYRGSYLGKDLPGFTSEQLQFFHKLLPEWHRFVRDLASELRNRGYRGPAGVDALLWRDPRGALQFKPLVELNPRWTMGRVAVELERHLVPGVSGLWSFTPLRDFKILAMNEGFETVEAYVEALRKKYPVKMSRAGEGNRIESGIIFTNDPARAQSVLTFLLVGSLNLK